VTINTFHKAVVGFGANLGNREQTARTALARVKEQIGELITASPLLENSALIPANDPVGTQPNFLNAVWIIETSLSPEACLNELIQIEHEHGRVRTYRWGARIIDLDLIAYDSITYESQRLVVPHPEMHKRDFVLIPMCQVWAEWVHPVLNRTAAELLAEIEK
jgi:2-amino-4-hydroxy-6-hydroxymethyldihydropteridine diphosphokinase